MSDITAIVGPNESGKSNLFDALYRPKPLKAEDTYKVNEDWPVDRWEDKKRANEFEVCDARFTLDAAEVQALFAHARKPVPEPTEDEMKKPQIALPAELELAAFRHYGGRTQFEIINDDDGPDWRGELDEAKLEEWGRRTCRRSS